MEEFLHWLVEFVQEFGYIGIFVMTALESTFVPIPSEITVLPAGYLIYRGEMDPVLTFLAATSGTVTGAIVNYYIAIKLGRSFLENYSKYFFLKNDKLDKIEGFFEKHGAISTFTGRLLPGIRHFISFPAGLARMNFKKFCIYTALGGGLWMAVLLGAGFYIGENEYLLTKWLPIIKACIVAVALLGVLGYWYSKKLASKRLPNGKAD